jgi:hypothetical protein
MYTTRKQEILMIDKMKSLDKDTSLLLNSITENKHKETAITINVDRIHK